MRSKHSFLMRDIVIAGILFSGIMALFIIIIGGVSTNYGRSDMVSQSFNDNFDKLNKMTGIVDQQTLSVSNTNGTGLQLEGNFDVMFGSSWGVISLIFSTLDTYSSMFLGLSPYMSFIPSSVLTITMIILISSLSAYIIFSVISSLLRGKL